MGMDARSGIALLPPTTAAAPRPRHSDAGSARSEDASLFEQALGRASKAKSPQQAAREAAEQLVSTAMVQPILKQMRENNNAAEPFKPNAAERSFRGMMDTAMAQKLVSSQRWGLVDRVADRLLARTTALKAVANPTPAANPASTPAAKEPAHD